MKEGEFRRRSRKATNERKEEDTKNKRYFGLVSYLWFPLPGVNHRILFLPLDSSTESKTCLLIGRIATHAPSLHSRRRALLSRVIGWVGPHVFVSALRFRSRRQLQYAPPMPSCVQACCPPNFFRDQSFRSRWIAAAARPAAAFPATGCRCGTASIAAGILCFAV